MVTRTGGRRVTAMLLVAVFVAVACTPGDNVDSVDVQPMGTASDEAGSGDPQPDHDSPATEPSADSSAPGAETLPPSVPSSRLDPSGLPPLSPPDPTTIAGALDNGLRYLIRDNDNPGGKVELRLVVDAGSGLEDDDQVGGAHYLEHMLFNGTERFPKNELVDVLRSFGAAFGADVNAYTSYDETVYTLNVPADGGAVDTALDVLEDWLSAATIDPVEVEAERGVILDEWRSRNQTSGGRVTERRTEFFLDGSRYEGHLPIGGRDAIESLTPEALRRFYDDWYRPDNASVIVVGDIDTAAIEAGIADRFSDATTRGSTPERPYIEVEPAAENRALVFGDEDLAEGSASIALPLSAREPSTPEADSQRRTVERLAFDIIANRLDSDGLGGDAPFERASRSGSSFVRDLDAPAISVDLDGADLADAVSAVVDEYERVARFGVTDAEVERVVAARRAAAQRTLDGSESRQDVSFADEYTRHLLEGEWYVTARQEFDFVSAVLDRVTARDVAGVFAERYRAAGVHVFAPVPDGELTDAASADELVAILDDAPMRAVEPRGATASIGDSLIDRLEPVPPVDRTSMIDRPFGTVIDPVVVEFANGLTAAFNANQIVENEVFLEARRLGGLGEVSDADVPDAHALGVVISDSGVGDFDRVAIDEFLDDKSVAFFPSVDELSTSMFGRAALDDLEVLFQFVHLLMTDPTADAAAVDRYVDDELPFAEDPSIDARRAEFVALTGARYDDPRFLPPTPDSLGTVDVEGIERVASQRFQVPEEWVFSFSGDLDIEAAIDLASRYLGTVPTGSAVASEPDLSTPPFPTGATVVEARAGVGDTANVSFLFEGEASRSRLDDVRAEVVRTVIGNRLTDVIREQLGDSYSPFARLDVSDSPQPSAELYISVSTAPDQVDDVSAAVLAELADLRESGPTQREYDNALATVAEQANFVNNGQINDEILDSLTLQPAATEFGSGFDDFLNQGFFIQTFTEDELDAALAEWTSDTDYIEVRVLPDV
ncbi:MAG: M16 family metallopeptidase [Ilumatobacter sp.]